MKISNATRWPLAATVLLATAAQAYQPAGQFKTEEQAKKYCPNDVVVRVDLATRRFYISCTMRPSTRILPFVAKKSLISSSLILAATASASSVPAAVTDFR